MKRVGMEKREGKGEKEENSRERDEEELIKYWVDLGDREIETDRGRQSR